MYPDIMFAAIREAGGHRLVGIETKGEQMAGNPEAEYKRQLLETLNRAYTVESGAGMTGRADIDLAAAVFQLASRTPGCRP